MNKVENASVIQVITKTIRDISYTAWRLIVRGLFIRCEAPLVPLPDLERRMILSMLRLMIEKKAKAIVLSGLLTTLEPRCLYLHNIYT